MLDFAFLAVGVSVPALVILLSYIVENRRWRGILAEQRRLHDLRELAESRYIAGNRLATMIAAMSLSISASTMHPDGLCPEAEEEPALSPLPEPVRYTIGADIPASMLDNSAEPTVVQPPIILVQTRFGVRGRDPKTGRFVRLERD